MNGVESILGALGGLAVFLGAMWAVIRGIFRQVNATDKNTMALNELSGKINSLDGTITNHEHRITVLEAKVK